MSKKEAGGDGNKEVGEKKQEGDGGKKVAPTTLPPIPLHYLPPPYMKKMITAGADYRPPPPNYYVRNISMEDPNPCAIC